MTQYTSRRLLGRFGQGWMDVNRAGNVFQDGAHFQSQRELGGQIRDMLANGL
jgi:hypothetical protein